MIEVQGLSRSWGAFSLKDVSLRVERDEYLVVLGPCGSGKTLLLETIAGLHQPERGRVLLDGVDVTHQPSERRRVGLVYQQCALFPHLSVRANIAYGLRYLGDNRAAQRRRVDEMLDRLGLRYLADRPNPVGLSGGESQKVALARALAVRPAALLLDEPLSSLDHQAAQRVMDMLRGIHAELDVPIIHVTHDYTEAASLADRIAVFNDGAVAQVGSVEEAFWRPRNRFVAEFLGLDNLLAGACRALPAGGSEVEVCGRRLVVSAPPPADRVLLCIRPEEVRLFDADPARDNTFPCDVRELTDHGFSVRLRLAFGSGELRASLPKQAFASLAATVGGRLFARLPAESIHLMAEAGPGDGHAD